MLAKVINVSVTETDVLVHVITLEGDDIRTTMFHPFYVKSTVEENGSRYNGEWKAASNLIAGDKLLTEDGRVIYVEEVRIERLAKNIKVYNLEIGDLHTYFVTGGVLVHNGCKKDIKQVNDAAREAGIPDKLRREFGDYIEELKKGKRNDNNFSYKELLEIAEEFMEWQ